MEEGEKPIYRLSSALSTQAVKQKDTHTVNKYIVI